MPALTIYFDGSCPLCRREIAFYKGNPDAAQLVWHDVSVNFQANDDSSLGDGLSCQRAMAFFHVRDAQGNLFKAVLHLLVCGWSCEDGALQVEFFRCGHSVGPLAWVTKCSCPFGPLCKSICSNGMRVIHEPISSFGVGC